MSKVIVKVLCQANGTPTPFDGQYVIAWDPHTEAGCLSISTTNDSRIARNFDSNQQALDEWKTISRVQELRPWDEQPNRPLTGISIEIIRLPELDEVPLDVDVSVP